MLARLEHEAAARGPDPAERRGRVALGRPAPRAAARRHRSSRAPRLRARAQRREAGAGAARRRRAPRRAGRRGGAAPPGVHAALVGGAGARRAAGRLGPAHRDADDRGADRGRWSASRRAPTPRSSGTAEALLARQGRRKYNTVALDEHGDVVAYTDIATTVHEPGRAYQWGTLVRPDARGHRLGLAVKVANLRLLAAQRPDLTELTTYNAEVNTPHGRGQRPPRLPARRVAGGVPEAAGRRAPRPEPGPRRTTSRPTRSEAARSRRRRGRLRRVLSWPWCGRRSPAELRGLRAPAVLEGHA